MKDEDKIQGLRDEIEGLQKEAEAKSAAAEETRARLASKERDLATLTATVFVGVVNKASMVQLKSKTAFGLLPDRPDEEGIAELRYDEDNTISVSISNCIEGNGLVMRLRIGGELDFDLYNDEYDSHSGLRIRAFASLKAANAWLKKQ